jgi:tRNA nucleotidyltransferase (CCA-adding enzyme)
MADVSPSQLTAVDHVAQPGLPARPARHVLRLAALFTSIPAQQLRATLRDLRFSNSDISSIARLGDAWTALGHEMSVALAGDSPVPDAVIRRWVAGVGRTQWSLVLRLSDAIWRAAREAGQPAPEGSAIRSVYRRGIRIAFRDPVELADLAVDGDDLRAAGMPPGPAIGRTLATLLDRVVADPSLNQRDTLMSIAKALVS